MSDVSEATKPVNGAKPHADTTTSAARLTASAVVGLIMSMPAYRHVLLTDLEWTVLPPLMLGQYELHRDKDRPVASPPGASSAWRPRPGSRAQPALDPKAGPAVIDSGSSTYPHREYQSSQSSFGPSLIG